MSLAVVEQSLKRTENQDGSEPARPVRRPGDFPRPPSPPATVVTILIVTQAQLSIRR